MNRIYIFTGKGGVGKSSVAAAHALKSAEEGKKTLLVSTDMAHNLGDIFGVKPGKEIMTVRKNLDIYEIDPTYAMKNDFSEYMDYVKKLLQMVDDSEAMGMIPGMEELFSLLKIAEIYKSEVYERMIVDCAPTGETLQLLKYPERLSDLINKVLPVKKKGLSTIGPMVEKIAKIPMPEENVFDDIEYLMDKMQRLQELLLNKDVVSLRVVTTPEKIVISEAKRNFTCLYLYHYNVDAVIVNHIYPEKAMEGYFSKWIRLQDDGLREIRESFSEVPKFYVELQKKELCTLSVLTEMGDMIYGDTDPDEVLFRKEIYTVDRDASNLRIYLPYADKQELELEQQGREIMVGIRNESRRFPLPEDFAEMEIAGAKFADGYLTIRFA